MKYTIPSPLIIIPFHFLSSTFYLTSFCSSSAASIRSIVSSNKWLTAKLSGVCPLLFAIFFHALMLDFFMLPFFQTAYSVLAKSLSSRTFYLSCDQKLQLRLLLISNIFAILSGNYGKSALFFAITRNRDEIVVEFLKRGAKVKIVNNKGQTPLSLAVSHLLEETILLIEAAEEEQKEVR